VASQPPEPSRLIRAARNQEPGALDRLLAAYRNYLLMFAQLWLSRSPGSWQDASDLVQDALLKAQQGFGQFRGSNEPELASWLRRILARRIADLLRHNRTHSQGGGRPQSLQARTRGLPRSMEGLLAESGTSPSEAAERREMGVILADALAEMSADRRRVIVLRSLEENDWEGVARAMGRSVGAVKMLWARALRDLRPRIEARL
jgi:RNA polymerase sigma-70 factor (ECF subfamily)